MRRVLPFVIFAILVCIFLWRPIFKGEALLPGDYLAQMAPWNSVVEPVNPPPQWNPLQWDAIAQFYPWRVFYARSMSEGYIPLWNPHQFCGTPFLANGQSAVLYPGNLLFLVFNPITAFTVFAALHLFLAAAFTYLLLRELGIRELGGIVGGIIFTFSAFLVLWLELPTFISVAVWLPMALLLIHRAVERRSFFYGMLAGGAIGLAFLAGHFQIAFYVALAAMWWWLWKLVETWRAGGRASAFSDVVVPFIGFAMIAALISAPQVLSSQELAINSHRVREVTAEGYSRFISNAVKPYRLVTAFQPDYFGSPAKNNYFLGSAADYMEYGLYAGILSLMLAAIGAIRLRAHRYACFFAGLAIFALLSALGTWVNAPFYYFVPGFSALGGPNRILLLYFLGIAVLAGYGSDYMAENGVRRGMWRGKEKNIAFYQGLLALHVVIFSGIAARLGAEHFLRGLNTSEPIHGFESPVYIALLLVSGLVLLARATDKISRSVFSAVAVFLIVADLFAFGINYNPTCDRAKVYPDTELTKKLQSLTRDGSRIAPINQHWSLYETPDAILPPNSAMVYGLYDVQGYDSLFTRDYKNMLDEIQGMDSSPQENGNMVLLKSDAFNMDFCELVTCVISNRRLDDNLLPDCFAATEPRRVDGLYIYQSSFSSGLINTGEGGHFGALDCRMIGPNRIEARLPDKFGYYFYRPGVSYTGWQVRAPGNKLKQGPHEQYRELVSGADHEVFGADRIHYSFQPFTFRLGLFLMLVGIGAIGCVGTFNLLRRKHVKP